TVGEFDRIIKSLYTNDITMAKTIYGEGDQAGLKDKVIKEVKATAGQGATVNTYKLVRENGTDVAVGIVDTDTKVVDNKLTFANGTLTSEITDNAGGTFASSVNGIASQEWVQEKIAEIPSIIDTNSITTVQNDGNGYVTVTGGQGDDGDYNYIVGFNEEKLIETIQANDKDTITTAESGHEIITVENNLTDTDNKNYKIGINEEALKGFIKDNTQDTNTITTVGADENGYVTVTEAPDPNQSGNHAYTVSFNEQKLIQTIEDQDRYVNGGSIGEDGSITLNVHNGRDVTLEGQMKDARLTDIERDKEAGTATLVVKDRYNPEEVNRLTIDDIASKAQNDRDHAEFREHFNELDYRVDNLGSRVDKVGAGAAALAALHPMDFDPDDKLTFAAGYGNYKGKNAAAVGAFYRPDEKVMLSVGGTFGNGENMVNAGISFSLDRTARVSNSRTAMAKEIVDLRANVANLTALVGQLTAGMGGTIEMDRMKLFPDVPENHWAYEYIGRLAAAGIIEGYPDGMFNGNRMMSRYEFAAMLYRALEKGVKLDHKLVREFEPEMGRIHVARISGADGDRGKIERVRVYGGDNRDHYGTELK
uniref:YadA-like family protein n=1 Tax=Phascolarctobacterium succinatutens TaxID=626940 RepID=UPI003A8F6A51